MKKLGLVLAFLVFLSFLIFSDTDGKEDVDFLLFMPNSSNQFVNQNRAAVQLDKLAKYLTDKNLVAGQICVYGYAAAAKNDIDPAVLSKDRALFVINELQKRGISKDLFSDPVAYGAVDLWGSNTNEANRIPNRRVRILVDGNLVTPAALKAEAPAAQTPSVDNTENTVKPANVTAESSSKFPWIILLILIILVILALLFFLLFKRRKNSNDITVQETAPVSPPPAGAGEEVRVIEPVAAPVVMNDVFVYLEDEIRFHAYELYLLRNGQNENAVEDWCRSVHEICAKYGADGYLTYMEEGCWWARKSS